MPNILDDRWDLLRADVLSSIFQLYDDSHPLSFYLGRNLHNSRLLMLVTDENPPFVKDLQSIKINSIKRENGSWGLLLTLEDRQLEPMFSLLCLDLIESSRNIHNHENTLQFVMRRLSGWRRLLERGHSKLLKESDVRGLIGELIFLQGLLNKLGFHSALRSWNGPFDASQDFQTSECSWEVKTIRPSASSVFISSELQLQVCISPIHLIVIELIDTDNLDKENSFSINNLVEGIRSILLHDIEAYDLFEERLSHTGYLPRSEYEEFRYRVGEVSTYEVVEGFPCITSETLKLGVHKVKYEIEISKLEKYLIANNF